MNASNGRKEIKIPIDCRLNYKGIAFDGKYYYFVIAGSCRILKTDSCFKQIQYYDTKREYNCICYDPSEHCFWVSVPSCSCKLYRLNCSLQEIDCVLLGNCQETADNMIAISYNCYAHTLLIAFSKYLTEYNKETGMLQLKYRTAPFCITGILSIAPGSLITVRKNNSQSVYVLNKDDKLIDEFCVPNCICLKTMLLNPCSSSCGKLILENFIFKNSTCMYLIKLEITAAQLGFEVAPCNDSICNEECSEPIPPKPGSCNDVLESIALVEAALSHILNAEGEKLQKVLASTSDIETILCVNREVNKTLINATHLEHALYAKLAAVIDCSECNTCQSNICKE
ncbi:MAG: hypothetical protein RRX92_03010 [Lachnospiraceae bacterium]